MTGRGTLTALGLLLAIVIAVGLTIAVSAPPRRPLNHDAQSPQPEPKPEPDSWRSRGRDAMLNRRPDEAIRIYEEADRSHPDDCEIAYNLSIAYKMTGQLEKAKARREQADRLRPLLPPSGMGAL